MIETSETCCLIFLWKPWYIYFPEVQKNSIYL